MITMTRLQQFMLKAAAEDRERTSVTTSGDTLEDALREAAIELSLPIKKIEYEVVQRGSGGVLGFKKQPYRIAAYPAGADADGLGDDDDPAVDTDLAVQENLDGAAFVRLASGGAIMLKVAPPVGSGTPVTERETMMVLAKRTRHPVDASQVSTAVKRADDEWIRVGDFPYDPAADTYVRVDIAETEMRASVFLTPPGDDGADPSVEILRAALGIAGVTFGHDEAALQSIEDRPVFDEAIIVAEGSEPQNGADAYMQYNFATEGRAVHLKETEDGRVDFKELNKVENVVEGQVLARKVPARQGEAGQTVTGKILTATRGQDLDPPLGPNTRLSDDGRSIIAVTNGLAKLQAGKVTVEPVYMIDGDVDIKEGNVNFLGTVVVRGNVADGFNVNAAGDIEVMGSVGRSVLDAEGDVIVHQGITGKSEGTVKAGGSIWSKFIENVNVKAGDMIVASDGIINSSVYAEQRIVCRGRRASVVGGHIRAAREVDAKTLGSVAGMETVVEVGYDLQSRERLLNLEQQDSELTTELEALTLDMQTIENMRKAKRSISKAKIQHYAQMKVRRAEIETKRVTIAKEMQELQGYLNQLKTQGRISVSGTVYPGVKVCIKDAALPIRHEMHAVTYVLNAGQVKITKYEESEADISVKRRED